MLKLIFYIFINPICVCGKPLAFFSTGFWNVKIIPCRACNLREHNNNLICACGKPINFYSDGNGNIKTIPCYSCFVKEHNISHEQFLADYNKEVINNDMSAKVQ